MITAKVETPQIKVNTSNRNIEVDNSKVKVVKGDTGQSNSRLTFSCKTVPVTVSISILS